MLTSVPVTQGAGDYRPIVGDAPIDEILRLAEPLRGARVLHLNATAFAVALRDPFGPGPLLNDLGLKADCRSSAAPTSSSLSPRHP